MNKQKGKRSVEFANPPWILAEGCAVGEKEGQGPLKQYFDEIVTDPMCGGNSWEEAESLFQQKAAEIAMKKGKYSPEEMRYLVAGDLLGQLMATSFGLTDMQIPLFGVYGACSTMGESLALGSMIVEGGFADKVLAVTSSHFASAEKQFRFPLAYGNQRPFASTWTVTGSGAVVLGNTDDRKQKKDAGVRITGITTGVITDYGIKDSANMGACMAPAAGDVITHHFEDFNRTPADYDRIYTGDLGVIGRDILLDILGTKNYTDLGRICDCGIEIFEPESQDTQAGGSGCGCSAVTLTGYILHQLRKRKWKRILFVPTGALLSPVSFNEGNTVPGIAHAIVLESQE